MEGLTHVLRCLGNDLLKDRQAVDIIGVTSETPCTQINFLVRYPG
jgi:hypothetical protein